MVFLVQAYLFGYGTTSSPLPDLHYERLNDRSRCLTASSIQSITYQPNVVYHRSGRILTSKGSA